MSYVHLTLYNNLYFEKNRLPFLLTERFSFCHKKTEFFPFLLPPRFLPGIWESSLPKPAFALASLQIFCERLSQAVSPKNPLCLDLPTEEASLGAREQICFCRDLSCRRQVVVARGETVLANPCRACVCVFSFLFLITRR